MSVFHAFAVSGIQFWTQKSINFMYVYRFFSGCIHFTNTSRAKLQRSCRNQHSYLRSLLG
jgi:hypothetical protein